MPGPVDSSLTLRFAVPEDERSLRHLADGAVIADPFHRTAALVELLRARAVQLTGPRAGRRLGKRLRVGRRSFGRPRIQPR